LRTGGVCRKDKRTADRRPKDMDRTKPVSGVNKKNISGKERCYGTQEKNRKKATYHKGKSVCIVHLLLLSSL